MLGRKDYTKEEFDHGKAAVGRELSAYGHLQTAMTSAAPDENLIAARERFEGRFFNSMVLVLDRYFVHPAWSRARTRTRSTKWRCSSTP